MKLVRSALIYPKGQLHYLTKGLDTSEFECRCESNLCHFTLVHEGLLETYEATRIAFGKPLSISSGYRCQSHNAATKNAVPRSYHTMGMAIDITPSEFSVEELDRLEAIARKHFSFVIRYETFIHCDVR